MVCKDACVCCNYRSARFLRINVDLFQKLCYYSGCIEGYALLLYFAKYSEEPYAADIERRI